MNDNVAMVFHGFLNLANLDKLKLVEAINDYFDSNEKEKIRAENETSFARLVRSSPGTSCKCCGRRDS